ncbi:MAG TPA: hypothetical protein VF786_03255 [Terriglobales bacterium]
MADGDYLQVPPETPCGCTNCQRVFPFSSIVDFWDDGEVPVCPHCGMDTVVISTADLEVTPERLFAMRRTW